MSVPSQGVVEVDRRSQSSGGSADERNQQVSRMPSQQPPTSEWRMTTADFNQSAPPQIRRNNGYQGGQARKPKSQQHNSRNANNPRNGYNQGHSTQPHGRQQNRGGSGASGRSRNSRAASPAVDRPFCFEVSDTDFLLTMHRDEQVQELYSKVVIEADVVAKVHALRIQAHHFLMHQQQNIAHFYEEKRHQDIQQWLENAPEDERKKYLERMQQQEQQQQLQQQQQQQSQQSLQPHQQQPNMHCDSTSSST